MSTRESTMSTLWPVEGQRSRHDLNFVWLECPECEYLQEVYIHDEEWTCENEEEDGDGYRCGETNRMENWIQDTKIFTLPTHCKFNRRLTTVTRRVKYKSKIPVYNPD